MKAEWAMGKDIFAEWEGDDNDMLSNVGPGKYFPIGLTCMVDGKEICWYCDCSPKGSMTSTILKRIMQMLDKHEIVKRGINGVTGKPYYPVMILDGHIS